MSANNIVNFINPSEFCSIFPVEESLEQEFKLYKPVTYNWCDRTPITTQTKSKNNIVSKIKKVLLTKLF